MFWRKVKEAKTLLSCDFHCMDFVPCMYIYTLHVYLVLLEARKRASNPLILYLQMVMSRHMGAGN